MSGGTEPARVALVIGSGSVKCAAALGVLRVLKREGIGIDLVVGCSGGSIYAASIALGWDVEEIIKATLRLWTRDITKKRKRGMLLKVLLPSVFGFDENFGMVDDRLVMRRLQDAFGEARIEGARLPLFITATDFHNGEQVVLREGRMVDAIRGSIAIPYIFAPFQVGERLLTDGYLSDPMPVGVAVREGADAILAIGFESPYQTRVSTVMRFAFQLSSIASNNLLKSNFSFHNLAHHGEVFPIIPQFEDSIRLFDTDKLPAVIEAGERAAESQLPFLLAALKKGALRA
jgi:NTE family protein